MGEWWSNQMIAVNYGERVKKVENFDSVISEQPKTYKGLS
jgi:hypothetical protein